MCTMNETEESTSFTFIYCNIERLDSLSLLRSFRHTLIDIFNDERLFNTPTNLLRFYKQVCYSLSIILIHIFKVRVAASGHITTVPTFLLQRVLCIRIPLFKFLGIYLFIIDPILFVHASCCKTAGTTRSNTRKRIAGWNDEGAVEAI